MEINNQKKGLVVDQTGVYLNSVDWQGEIVQVDGSMVEVVYNPSNNKRWKPAINLHLVGDNETPESVKLQLEQQFSKI